MGLKKNNRGSTLVLVLVVMALVGILASVALWISLNNFQMKITNQNVTDSFYSAEAILDQISAGLQNEVSEAYTDAYSKLLAKYTDLSTDSDKTQYFASKFVDHLKGQFQYSDGTGTLTDTCAIDLLKGYISTGITGTCVLTSSEGSADYCSTSVMTDKSGVTNGLSINGVCVDYTDADGYLSQIETDIVIQIPSMKIASAITPPSIADYCLIGNSGVVADRAAGLSIAGGLYAGKQEGLSILYATVSFSTPAVLSTGNNYVIVDGDVTVEGTSDTAYMNMTTNEDVQLWANDIVVKSASAGLFGSTFAGDDLVLSGTSPLVSFEDPSATIPGTYYGFGNNTSNADESSAVVLNGTGCILNLNGLSSMTLCGYSFIGTGAITHYTSTSGSAGEELGASDGTLTSNQVDLMMGESISVKGDQIAYLVPSECIGVSVDAMTIGTNSYRNPMTYAEYASLKKEVETDRTKVFVSKQVNVSKVGNPLSAYTGSSDDFYQTIFVPKSDGGLVYFYLKLDGAEAEQYFSDYTKMDSSKLLKYTDFYTTAISCADTSIIKAPGTALTYEESAAGNSVTYMEGTSSADSSKYQSMYAALCKTLCTDESKYSVIGADVFSTILAYDRTNPDNDVLYRFLGDNNTISEEYADGTRIVLTSVDNYVLTAEDCAKKTLILATGDVSINPGAGITGFTGCMIAKGTIRVNSGSNFTITPMGDSFLRSLLTQTVSNDGAVVAESGQTKIIYNFFREGSAYLAESGMDTGTGTQLSDLIVYQNWKKK
jgi:type II secretory pathway pseudopilin PulG